MFFLCLLVLRTKSLDNCMAAMAFLILALSTHGRDFPVGNRTFKSSQPRMQRQDAKIPHCITKSDGKQTSPTLIPYLPDFALFIEDTASYHCHQLRMATDPIKESSSTCHHRSVFKRPYFSNRIVAS